MQRLAQFDVSRQFVSRPGQLAAQVGFGFFCATAMVGVRSLFDLWAPVSGPFALVYPTVLLATLYGHWRGGLTALVVSFAWAWYFILPTSSSFAFAVPTDAARVALNASCAVVVLVFAEAFRRAARRTVEEISEAAERRMVLLADLEHRTKNNFALVASLLELHKRSLDNRDLDGPIDDAVGRVRSFADAYSHLQIDDDVGAEVVMGPYLDQLLTRVHKAALRDNVEMYREIDALVLPRQIALAIGLYANEAVCNCAKYAFPDGRPGTVSVSLVEHRGGWRLTVEDDGIGLASDDAQATGLGSNLLRAFAQQARARHAAGPTLRGYRCEMVFEPITVA